jgi:hypothetical protein
MQTVEVYRNPESTELYLGIIHNPNRRIEIYNVDEFRDCISRLTKISDYNSYDDITLFLDTSILKGAPMFILDKEYNSISGHDIRSLIYGKKHESKDQLMSIINSVHIMHMANMAALISGTDAAIGTAAKKELEYRAGRIENSLAKSNESTAIPSMPRFRLIKGGDRRYFQSYDENELHGLRTLLQASVPGRSKLEETLSRYGNEYQFIVGILHQAYEQAYRIEEKMGLAQSGRMLGLDDQVIAEAIIYSLAKGHPVNILTMDKHFAMILESLSHNKRWFYASEHMLHGRPFNLTIHKVMTPNNKNNRMRIGPSMKIDYYDRKLGIYNLDRDESDSSISQSHIVLL